MGLSSSPFFPSLPLQGNAAAVRSLVGGGAAADPANDDGDTPLHLASQADMIYYNIYYNIL